MNRIACRLCLSILPATFAFFLVSVFAMVIVNSEMIAALVGLVASLTSAAVIIKH